MQARSQWLFPATWSVVGMFTCIAATAYAGQESAHSTPFMPESLKDWVSIGTSLATCLIAAYGIWNALKTASKAIQEKRFENRQKQLGAGKSQLKEMFDDPMARSAMRMLDWSGRSFSHGKEIYTINWSELEPALVCHTRSTSFTPQQQFIRDCFESFYDHLLVMEHFIKMKYLNEADIAIPLEYYASKIVQYSNIYDPFLEAYGYREARDLLHRLAERKGLKAPLDVSQTG